LNILFTVHHFLDLNAGASGATHDLATQYRQLGHSVEIYSFDDLPLPASFSERERNMLFPFFGAAHIKSRLRRGQIDVIDASSGDAWLLSFLMRRARKARPLLVTRSHGVEHRMHDMLMEEARRGNLRLSWKYPLYHGGWRLREVARSFRRSDLNIVLNQTDKRYLIDKLRVSPERIRVIPHGISESFFDLPLSPTPLENHDPLSIAYVGRHDFRKGYGYLVEALSEVLARYPHVTVGFFGCLCAPEVILRDYDPDVRSRIRVVPEFRRSALPKLLSGYHIKVFPTLGEGFGLALVEAMACGLAPVVTAVPGPLDIVTDGYDAIVIPPRDTQAITGAIEALINDVQRLDALRKNAQNTAQGFRWRTVADTTLEAYREFLEREPGREGSKDAEDGRAAANMLRAS
jgi:glycosyltransferase involved in cell wall biosynthesis